MPASMPWTMVLPILLAAAALGGTGWFFIRRKARFRANKADPETARVAKPKMRGGDYSPENVGNDASARPWERSSMSFHVDAALKSAQTTPASSSFGLAQAHTEALGLAARQRFVQTATGERFDVDAFLVVAREQFIALQSGWDRCDLPALRRMMTHTVFVEIEQALNQRQSTHPLSGGTAQHQTELLMLDVKWLGLQDVGASWLASVEFSGMMREGANEGPQPFREVWSMLRGKTEPSSWLVEGVQALV